MANKWLKTNLKGMETKQTIYQKLLKAQSEISAITKDSENPFFKSNYFDINALLAEIKPVLNSNGLIVLQPIQNNELGNILETIIVDSESGEKITGSMLIPSNPDPQKVGSIITYFRRYALQSMLGLQAEDDDGNEASVNNYNKKDDLREQKTQDNKKYCDYCGKWHDGNYNKCLECWQKEKETGKKLEKIKEHTLINQDADPF